MAISTPAQAGERRPRASRSKGANLGDRLFMGICRTAALLVILLFVALFCVLLGKSLLAVRTLGFDFLYHSAWDPAEGENHEKFGALAFVYGTVATSLIAMVIAVPLGVGTASFLSEIASGWVRRTASFLVEMLAAIPSVVYGFWGMFFLAPLLQKAIVQLGGPNEGGLGILAAGLILAIMIVPYVTAISFDVCQAVPRSQREGSLALGASRWQTIWSVVLPYARPGIIGGCFLALGRALGETMAVTMLIGNRPEIRFSPFALGDSIASAIANQYREATYPLYLSALTELGLLLLLVTIIVNSLARILIWRVGRPKLRPMSAPIPLADSPSARELKADSRLLALHLGRARFQGLINHGMTGVLGLCLLITLGTLFVILGYLVYEGVGALNWKFFVSPPVPAGETGGGVGHAILGSAMLVATATFFAVPVGLLAAIYLAEYRSGRLGALVRFIGELLAGVPSIVIGIFAAAVLAIPTHLFGWSGAFALGIMMIPVVMRASEESLRLVPAALRNASYALGARQWQTVLRVSVPAALPAIITGIFLAVARIAGETAPLLLTAGDSRFWPRRFLSEYTPSLPVYVFNYAKSPFPEQNRQAWAAAFVLLSIVMLLNFGIRFLTGKRVVLASRAD